jgi:DNA-binding CsgD family transcriptional regulator
VLEGFTPRQREIALLVAEQLTNEEIGGRLGIAPATVKKHLEHIFAATGVRTRGELERLVARQTER